MHPLKHTAGNLRRSLNRSCGFHDLRYPIPILFTLCLLTGSYNNLLAAPVIGPTAVTPTSVPAGAPTLIRVTSTITDPSLIARSVTLQQVSAEGTTLAIIGPMNDGGANGDQVIGDRTFSLQFTLKGVPGPIYFRVSAAFRKSLRRAFSSTLTVNVTGSNVSSLTENSFVTDLSSGIAPADVPSFSETGDQSTPLCSTLQLVNENVSFVVTRTLFVPPPQDFETFRDMELVTTQLRGLTFSNTIARRSGDVGGSLNEQEFPPYSPDTVVSDYGGPITIVFQSPVRRFGAAFTYAVPLVVEAFDAQNNLVASATSRFSSNLGVSGVPGSEPNEIIELSYKLGDGISKVRITADMRGDSFTMDNMGADQDTQPLIDSLQGAGAGGQYFIDGNLENKISKSILHVRAVVAALSGSNKVISAVNGGDGRVGGRQNVGSLAPGGSIPVRFGIALEANAFHRSGGFVFEVNWEGCVAP